VEFETDLDSDISRTSCLP